LGLIEGASLPPGCLGTKYLAAGVLGLTKS
jgi:hypothetical protein